MLKQSKKLLTIILAMMACSCTEKEPANAGGDENGNSNVKPVITGGYSYDGYEKIIIEGYNNLEELPGASVSYGIMFSDTDLTTDAKNEEADEKDANNKFSCTINVKPGGELYYYRAYAIRSGETFYGEIKTLTTKELVADPGPIVDMGVSVKWASCNLGATKPEMPGEQRKHCMKLAMLKKTLKIIGNQGNLRATWSRIIKCQLQACSTTTITCFQSMMQHTRC